MPVIGAASRCQWQWPLRGHRSWSVRSPREPEGPTSDQFKMWPGGVPGLSGPGAVQPLASASADSSGLAYALHESFKFKLDRAPSQIECLCLTVTGFIKHPFALKEVPKTKNNNYIWTTKTGVWYVSSVTVVFARATDKTVIEKNKINTPFDISMPLRPK